MQDEMRHVHRDWRQFKHLMGVIGCRLYEGRVATGTRRRQEDLYLSGLKQLRTGSEVA